jgi:hypothetical protein
MRPLAAIVIVVLGGAQLTCKNNDAQSDLGPPPDVVMWPDTRGVSEPFGRTCELGKQCTEKDIDGYPLVCIGVAGGAQGRGFCSRSCTDVGGECYGVPNGQMASCFLEASKGDAGPGDKFCGFLCKTGTHTWTCPGGMKCGETGKDGTAICVPTDELPPDGGVQDRSLRDKPSVPPNSGKICSTPAECAEGDGCVAVGGVKKMCLAPCDPQYPACGVPDPTKNASACFKFTATQHYCVWLCLYEGKSYECPTADFECYQIDQTQPNLKICKPK